LKDPLLILEENVSINIAEMEKKIPLVLDTIEKSISTLFEADGPHQNTESLNVRLLELAGNISTDLTKVRTKLSARLDKTVRTISTLKARIASLGCLGSEGFFSLSTQCFKMFKDVKLNWADAKSHCESHDLILAEPSDAVALDLRKYVVDSYGGSHRVWLGGYADGSKWVWQ
ncbi:unnamed protein product, partial [Meganyctiphanes norvegica]